MVAIGQMDSTWAGKGGQDLTEEGHIGVIGCGGTYVGRSMPRSLGDDEGILLLIEQEITERGLIQGSRLPTERELAVRSGCSRSAVRRALATLEADGRVERHVGRGTFLALGPCDGPAASGQGASTSPAEIMAVRLLLEPQTMALAVAAATSADFAEMARCQAAGERAVTHDEFELWDEALHRSFASATHNSLMMRIAEMLTTARDQPVWGSLKRRNSTIKRRADYRHDHQIIVAALMDRDATAAQTAMRRHLLRVRANVLGEHI